MDIDTVIFDWGGTLSRVDRQPTALYQGAREVVKLLMGRSDDGLAQTLALHAMAAEKEAAAGPDYREVDVQRVLTAWSTAQGGTSDANRVAEAIDHVGRSWVGAALDPVPGALDTLQILKQRGLRLGLVSNVWIPPAYCRQELERQGFAPCLDFTVFSSGVGYRKPSSKIYQAALHEAFGTGAQPDPDRLSRVLFVGDSPSCDVMGPAALGMKTALVASAPGAWPAAELEQARPDFRLDTVAALPDLLDG